MEELFNIKNGNCQVILYSNGTRIVSTDDNFIYLKQPLSLDINISNRCSNGCPYCYAGNTPNGKVANLLDMHYLDNITGLEIAINIQYPLPEFFEYWLTKMKNQNIIVNGTINQIDFERDINILYYLKQLSNLGLIHGIGVSFKNYNETLYQTIKEELGENIVIHVIVGITPLEDVRKLLDNGFKVLVLGYKQKNRGIEYFNNNDIDIDKWAQGIRKLIPQNESVIAFDTSGLRQSNIKNCLTDEEWNNSYQGDEGTISFYIDAVNNTFNIDSHTSKPPYNIGNFNVEDMFAIVKERIKYEDN